MHYMILDGLLWTNGDASISRLHSTDINNDPWYLKRCIWLHTFQLIGRYILPTRAISYENTFFAADNVVCKFIYNCVVKKAVGCPSFAMQPAGYRARAS